MRLAEGEEGVSEANERFRFVSYYGTVEARQNTIWTCVVGSYAETIDRRRGGSVSRVGRSIRQEPLNHMPERWRFLSAGGRVDRLRYWFAPHNT